MSQEETQNEIQDDDQEKEILEKYTKIDKVGEVLYLLVALLQVFEAANPGCEVTLSLSGHKVGDLDEMDKVRELLDAQFLHRHADVAVAYLCLLIPRLVYGLEGLDELGVGFLAVVLAGGLVEIHEQFSRQVLVGEIYSGVFFLCIECCACQQHDCYEQRSFYSHILCIVNRYEIDALRVSLFIT